MFLLLNIQFHTGDPLGNILTGLGLVSQEVINEMLRLQNFKPDPVDPCLLKTVPDHVVRRYRAVPIKKEGNCLKVAMVDPLDVLALDDLRLLTGCEIEPVKTDPEVVEARMNQYFNAQDSGRMFTDLNISPTEQAAPAARPEEENVDEAPIVRLVNSIFLQAIEQKASDIHIEPQQVQFRVRYRIDGMLREVMSLPGKTCSAVISRVKIMANMDIAEKRVPQDGRIQLNVSRREIDIRVSSLPTLYGEKIVARLLDKQGIHSFTLDRIGFEENNLKNFTSAIKGSYGMILITGPTGSGKTTTLYATLNDINAIEKNVITVEDPVEYRLDGLNQVQVNNRAGMTFAAGLRAILRQDPDIIMVGEIRDGETAKIAVKAATTGHLVFSTLHTNDASGAITRLVDMGIEPFLVASSVLVIVAQRLVRLVCLSCKQPYQLSPDSPERAFSGVPRDKPLTLYKGAGCEKCGNTGYMGRMAIHEVLPVTTLLRPLILRKASSDEIKQRALGQGMVTLKNDGILKALQGLTSMEEVMRVAYIDET